MRLPFGTLLRSFVCVFLALSTFGTAHAGYANSQAAASASCQKALAETLARGATVQNACTLVINYTAAGGDDDAYYLLASNEGSYPRHFMMDPIGNNLPVVGCPTGNCGVAGVDPGTSNRSEAIAVAPDGAAPGLTLTYNSMALGVNGPAGGSAGLGVRHTYQRQVFAVTGTSDGTPQTWAYVERPDGNLERFVKLSATQWQGSADNPTVLVSTVDAQSNIMGWTRSQDGTVETFTAAGRLDAITDRAGNERHLAYDTSGKLVSVADEHGRAIGFTYNSAGEISKVTKSDGSETTLTYSDHRLSTITQGSLPARTLLYGESGYVHTSDDYGYLALTGILDEAGNRIATTHYDADHRVTRSHGTTIGTSFVNDFTFAYTGGYGAITQTVITHPLDGTETRTFQNVLGRNLTTSQQYACTGCTTRQNARTYDSNGYPNVFTDFGDVETDSDYDTSGLLTQTILAKGMDEEQTVTTQWNTTLRVPTRINRPGQQWDYTYNTRGQVLTVKVTDTATSLFRTMVTYGYCDVVDTTLCPLVGLLRNVNGPRTDVADITTYRYRMADDTGCATGGTCAYRKGDLWRVTNAASQITEVLALDGAGRVTSVLDPNGVVTDLVYSPLGQLTATKVRGADNGMGTKLWRVS